MNNLDNGNIPMLGPKQELKAGVQGPFCLIRTMDENGHFTPESTVLINGQPQAIAGRTNIVSAEDLVDMITDSVMAQLRKELIMMMKEMKGST